MPPDSSYIVPRQTPIPPNPQQKWHCSRSHISNPHQFYRMFVIICFPWNFLRGFFFHIWLLHSHPVPEFLLCLVQTLPVTHTTDPANLDGKIFIIIDLCLVAMENLSQGAFGLSKTFIKNKTVCQDNQVLIHKTTVTSVLSLPNWMTILKISRQS